MKAKAILIAIFAVLLAVSTGHAQGSGKDEAAIKGVVKNLTDAQVGYDAAALDRIFTADYIEISPVGEFDVREKVLGFYKPELKPAADKLSTTVETDQFSMRNYGKFAIVITRLTYSIMAEGKAVPPRSMRLTLVLRKEKDSWKIASAQYTGIRAAQPQK